MSNSDALLQRDTVLLQQARSLSMNKGFLLLFVVSALVGVAGLFSVVASGMWGWIIVAALAVIGGAGIASGKVDVLMSLGIASIAALTGVVSLIVSAYVIFGIHH